MTTATAGPVRLTGHLDAPLSRWLWLVKWVLALPHFLVLALLWPAFVVLSLVAFVAILLTGRYPRAIFDFTVGVLRWSWRVGYYTYGALGTDRYPPFTLHDDPDYPARLEIAYPEHLSRGLALVKWWLLALPHYLVIGFFLGGGSYAAYQAGSGTWRWSSGAGLIGVLVLFAAVALLVTGRYPRGLFDLLLGLHRWVLRVVAYSALMTDSYPPFRLDLGGDDPAALAVPPDPPEPGAPPPAGHWSAGRVVTVVVGSLLLLGALGGAAGATALLVADRAARDAEGYLTTPTRTLAADGHALVFDPVEARSAEPGPEIGELIGAVRVRADAAGTTAVFIGIGPADAVEGYLGGVARGRVVDFAPGREPVIAAVAGGAPAGPPGEQGFWVAEASGPGAQELVWDVADGRWAAVVMAADGSRPVVAELSAGVTAPALRRIWTGLYLGAAVAAVLGALLVGLAVPRSR